MVDAGHCLKILLFL